MRTSPRFPPVERPIKPFSVNPRPLRLAAERRAGLPELSWRTLRHTFATHAARFGVNPWRLQAWLGHSTITMTMRYVHHVEEHHRSIPEGILAAGNAVVDPDARIVAMLGARSDFARGNGVATEQHALTGT